MPGPLEILAMSTGIIFEAYPKGKYPPEHEDMLLYCATCYHLTCCKVLFFAVSTHMVEASMAVRF